MINQNDISRCSVFPKRYPQTSLVAIPFNVDGIVGKSWTRKCAGGSMNAHPESYTTFSNIGVSKCASMVVPQLPAWIYATRFSRQGLPPGYNMRRSQKQPREKKIRQIFSGKQLERLAKEFSEERYVTALKRQELASDLGLTETQVKTWFQNRRTKWRKEIRAEIVGNRPVVPTWSNSLSSPHINTGKHLQDPSLLGHLHTSGMAPVLVSPYGCT